ncbi:MAG: hypothetical protein ACFFBD_00045 [Candidatus Hodarchaeota archaeon]
MAAEYVSYMITVALGMVMLVLFVALFAGINHDLTVFIGQDNLKNIAQETSDFIEEFAYLIDKDPNLTESFFQIDLPQSVVRLTYVIKITEGNILQAYCPGKPEINVTVEILIPTNFIVQGEFSSAYDIHRVSYTPPGGPGDPYVLTLESK